MKDETKNVPEQYEEKPLTTHAAKRGMEEPTDRDDIKFPRAKLMQFLSPEVTSGICKPGQIINNLTSEELPVKFVPIMKFTNYIKFNPKNAKDPNYDSTVAPGAIIWATNEPTDPRVAETKFGANGSKPTAIKFLNIMAVFEGSPIPTVISFCKTSMKAGQKLVSMMMFKQGDVWNWKYALTSRKEQGAEGDYYVFDVQPSGASEPDEKEMAVSVYESMKFKAKEIKVDHQSEWNE